MASVVALVLLLLAGIWGFWPTSEQSAGSIDSNDPALVAQGQEVYATACASCHGADLEGQTNWRERGPDGRLPAPPHDETGHTWHHSDRQLFEITKYGVERFAPAGYESDMPAFEDNLSDEEIRAVLAYIKSRWPESERRSQARATALDEESEG
ncbi:c-type cytochrome [Aquibaculum sediminis]|uniref:c-type cytochrome n=1 Tax=Aquibaculum sediminis TaxID=3231907 RepID=UPI0034530B3C